MIQKPEFTKLEDITAAEAKRSRKAAKRAAEMAAAKDRIPVVTYLDNSNRTKAAIAEFHRIESLGHVAIMVQQGDGSFDVVDAGAPT